MKAFYFSHPFPERHDCKELEEQIEKKYNVKLYNPFYETWKDYVSALKKLDKNQIPSSEFEKLFRNGKVSKKIVEWDMERITNSDGIIAVLPYPSIGCSMEIFYAAYVLKKPVVVWSPNPIYGFDKHPWLLYFAKVAKTKEDFLKLVEELINGQKTCDI